VISPIVEVRSPSGPFTIGDGGKGPVTQRIYEQLTGIQRGKIADTHGWVHRVT